MPLRCVLLDKQNLNEYLNDIYQLELENFLHPWSENSLAETLNDKETYCYVLFNEKKLCGFAIFQSMVFDVELLQICIAKQNQGQGLGKELLKNSILLLKNNPSNYEKIFLEVRESNERAISLYQKLGFEVDGIRKNYYKATANTKAENAVNMSLILH